MLEDLTVIIPTYNREKFALRSICYWKNSKAVVHILDGSSVESTSVRNAAQATNNIHYHFIPLSFKERLQIATGLINTKYAMFSSDDEFMVFSGIESCLDFLEKNKDYQQCVGRVLSFQRTFLNSLTLSPIKSRHRFHQVDQENPLDRILYHISNFNVTTIYGVHTADSFRECLNIANNQLVTINPYVFETVFELLAASIGKSKVLPYLSWLRSTENNPVVTADFTRHEYISMWYSNPANADEVQQMFGLIEGYLIEKMPHIKEELIIQTVRTAIDNRVAIDREGISLLAVGTLVYQKKDVAWRRKFTRVLNKISLENIIKIFFKNFYINKKIHDFFVQEKIIILNTKELISIFELINKAN